MSNQKVSSQTEELWVLFEVYSEEIYLLCGMPSWNEGNGIESTKPPSRGVRWFYTQSQKRTTLQQPTVYFTQPSSKTSSTFQDQGGSTMGGCEHSTCAILTFQPNSPSQCACM